MLKLKSRLYSVVDVHDFVDQLIDLKLNPDNMTAYEMLQRISDSGHISFGDAYDTIVTAQKLCGILQVCVPDELDPDTLIGLGS
jgi:hypothetical protein